MISVQAGDVLLTRGKGFVSKAIRFLDGSEVNHAAIALSDVELAEATGHGLDRASIGSVVERNELVVVRRLAPADTDAARRSVDRATSYLDSGVPYAYQQILLLAVLCATRRIPITNRLFRRALRRLLDGAAELINGFIDKGADVMICSEYVYRCYRESGTDLLPAGVPELADVGAAGDGELLLDWLAAQPVPVRPASIDAVPARDPMAVAERLEFDLDELFGAYFASQDPGVAPMRVEAGSPDVTDEDLALSAAALGAAATRLANERDPSGVRPLGLGAADALAVFKGMFSTNANFVTPRDLLFTTILVDVDRTG